MFEKIKYKIYKKELVAFAYDAYKNKDYDYRIDFYLVTRKDESKPYLFHKLATRKFNNYHDYSWKILRLDQNGYEELVEYKGKNYSMNEEENRKKLTKI